MINENEIAQALSRLKFAQPAADSSNLRIVKVRGTLSEALELKYPMCRLKCVTSDGASIGALIALTNYSDAVNIAHCKQAMTAMAMRLVRNDVHEIEFDVVVENAGSAGAWSAFRSLLQKRYRGAFVYEQWNIAVGHIDGSMPVLDVVQNNLKWCPDPSVLTFDADPFVVDLDGHIWVLYEHLGKSNKGVIRARRYSEGKFFEDVLVLEQTTHVSYPYVLRINGEPFVIPEASGSGETVIYRLIGPKPTLVDPVTILPAIGLIDPTLFEHDGQWWLFGTMAGLSDNAALFVWHSNSPFGPFCPHTLNPVKIDVRSARPGGTPWVEAGIIHRPAQDSSIRYGGGLSINRIDQLTSTAFLETVIDSLTVPSSRYPLGFHTLARDGEYVALDGLRDSFTPRKLMHMLSGKLGLKAR